MIDCGCESANPDPSQVYLTLDILASYAPLHNPGSCGRETDDGGSVPGGFITSVKVTLNNENAACGNALPVALHEIGHGLGIGHSSDQSDLMAAVNGTGQFIGDDEKCALIYIYRMGGPCYASATPAP